MSRRDSLYLERFRATLAHQPVDRCPIDLGGTPQSTMDSGMGALAEHLGYAGLPPADYDKFDRRILEHWDIDFRRCGALIPFTTGREERLSDTLVVDGYGIRHRHTGLHWEMDQHPLHGAGRDEVAAYELPTLDQAPAGIFEQCAAAARRLHDETPYVVVAEHPVFGVLELACWLGGYDWLLLKMAEDPELVHLLFSKILAFQKPVVEAYYRAVGPSIDLTTSGDDFGTQKGLFMSPGMFREFVKPYLAERIAWTHRFTDAVYMHHSCGAVFDIVGDLHDIGVRILNPIQPVAGMAPEGLKAAYGERMVFHGGLDTQAVLPGGDAGEILVAVERLLGAMRPWETGGYIFAAAHNLQGDVAPAAIAAMYDAALAAFGCA
ncbi:MAG: methyltransferase [Armatimonadetes bacterium]|nr:methyltransferase [Armatimonadota bacterium]